MDQPAKEMPIDKAREGRAQPNDVRAKSSHKPRRDGRLNPHTARWLQTMLGEYVNRKEDDDAVAMERTLTAACRLVLGDLTSAGKKGRAL